MSFTAEVKSELAGLPLSAEECPAGEIWGVVRFGGTLRIHAGSGLSLAFSTELQQVADRIGSLLTAVYGCSYTVQSARAQRLYKHDTYTVQVSGRELTRRMLRDAGVTLGGDGDPADGQLPPAAETDAGCRCAFLRGAFLMAGMVADPTTGYHMELVVPDDGLCASVMVLLTREGIYPRSILRKDSQVIYLKEAQAIEDCLNLLGAREAARAFAGQRAERGLRNQLNRMVNCDNANVDKAVLAGEKQIQAIRYLEGKGRFSSLSPALREAAEVRMENPEATLEELAELLPGVSRSAMNHRLRKIAALAEETAEKELS